MYVSSSPIYYVFEKYNQQNILRQIPFEQDDYFAMLRRFNAILDSLLRKKRSKISERKGAKVTTWLVKTRGPNDRYSHEESLHGARVFAASMEIVSSPIETIVDSRRSVVCRRGTAFDAFDSLSPPNCRFLFHGNFLIPARRFFTKESQFRIRSLPPSPCRFLIAAKMQLDAGTVRRAGIYETSCLVIWITRSSCRQGIRVFVRIGGTTYRVESPRAFGKFWRKTQFSSIAAEGTLWLEKQKAAFVGSFEFLAFLPPKTSCNFLGSVNPSRCSSVHAAMVFAGFRKFHCKSLCATKRFSFGRTYFSASLSINHVRLSKWSYRRGASFEKHPLRRTFHRLRDFPKRVKFSSEIVFKTLRWFSFVEANFFRPFEGKEWQWKCIFSCIFANKTAKKIVLTFFIH